MRVTVATILGLVLVSAAFTAPADEASDLRQLVDKAILATGGADKVQSLNAARWTTRGTFMGRESNAEFHGELPDKFRIDSKRVVDGKTINVSRIIRGDQGWLVEDGVVKALPADQLAGVRNTFYSKGLVHKLDWLKGNDVKLSALGGDKLDGRDIIGVKAVREGFPEVKIYFDAETHLVRKVQSFTLERGTGRPIAVEFFYEDYRKVDGRMVAHKTRQFQDGKLFAYSELQEFQAVPNLPPEKFQVPR